MYELLQVIDEIHSAAIGERSWERSRARDRAPPGAIGFARHPAKSAGLRRTLETRSMQTPPAARIAEVRAQGRPRETIAGRRHSNLQTLRKHVRAICAKTVTQRHAGSFALNIPGAPAQKREG